VLVEPALMARATLGERLAHAHVPGVGTVRTSSSGARNLG
jgi:hypothetical protein